MIFTTCKTRRKMFMAHVKKEDMNKPVMVTS